MLKPALLLTFITSSTTADIEACAVRRSWPENAVLFRQGEHCSGLHFVKTGLVKLYVASPDGREQIVAVRQPNAAVTIIPLLDRGVYPMSAHTLSPTQTLFISRERFDFLFATRSDFRDAVLAEAGSLLRGMVSLAETISLKRVPSRVAYRVLEQADALGALRSGMPFRMNMTQEDLSHLVGATRESVARALAQLRAAGVIEQRGRMIRVLNAVALSGWAHGADDMDHERTALSA